MPDIVLRNTTDYKGLKAAFCP